MTGNVTRRRVLGSAASAWLAWAIAGNSAHPVWAAPRFEDYPFMLGVASGDPLPDSVLIWTRLAPDPLAEDGRGGMPERVVPVNWQVAEDEAFRVVAAAGAEPATPELGHSVHAEVTGLRPGRTYYYRFRVGRETSPVGTTRTAPAVDEEPSILRFAHASCQNVPRGYFTAYQDMVDQDLDLVLFLGDYIYEGGAQLVRNHEPPRELYSLSDYRIRYAQYKSDPDLQAVHARYPWLVVFDDHEVDNDWAGDIPEDDQTTEEFLRRRAIAFQVFYESIPLRLKSRPDGSDMRLHRRLDWGRLATFHMLDTRQYRDPFACGSGGGVGFCPEVFDPNRSILGFDQEDWLVDGFRQSRARWHFIGQQVPFARRLVDRDGQLMRKLDAWDGYQPCQQRITRGWVEAGVRNAVVMSGDVHADWVADIKLDYDDPDAPLVGSDFVATSITSDGDGEDWIPTDHPVVRNNSNVHFFTDLRGYVMNTVTREQLQTDLRCVPYISQRGAETFTRASFVIKDGTPGVRQVADQPLLQIAARANTMFKAETSSVLVSLRNPTDHSVTVTVTVETPADWNGSGQATVLAAREEATIELSVTPPGGPRPIAEDLTVRVTVTTSSFASCHRSSGPSPFPGATRCR